MKNGWKEVWERREDRFSEIDMSDSRAVFTELKRIDGFDVIRGGIKYEALVEQNSDILRHLSKYGDIQSIFDVGCGCGANMYLFYKGGFDIGGMDYSSAQICIANKIFENGIKELLCGEAIDMPTDVKYDAVISNSVFSYFPDEEYAEAVLNRMLIKSRRSIALVDVHDIDKKEAFINYRQRAVKDYNRKYKDLHKLFYSKEFFLTWAEKNDLKTEFVDSNIEGYWNNEFVFNVYFYKNQEQ